MRKAWPGCSIIRSPVLIVAIGTLVLAVLLYIEIPKGFFPQQDTGRLNGSIVADQAISFQAMQAEDRSASRPS
jgi:multidrug efflux pump